MDNFEIPETEIQHLIIRNLEGSASDEEILSLQEWLSLSERNFALYADFRKYWLRAGQDQRYEVGRAWRKMDRRLEQRKSKSYSRFWIKASSYAAVVILVVAIGYYATEYNRIPVVAELAGGNIEPGSKKAILVLGSNEKVELNGRSGDSLLTNNAVMKNEGNTLVYNDDRQENKREEYNRLITPRGGEYSVVLSDGTKVWLNAESELKYPVQFAGGERRVYLKGEAYFAVKKQVGQSFVVCSDKARITVLGTEFNVRNYEADAIATTLVKGSVVVAHEGGRACKLVPGQQAVVNRAGGIEVREVETGLYTAWKDGFFVYRDRTLDDILKELSRWYDFTYFYQNSVLENMVLTAKIRKFDSVNEIFEILSETGRFGFVTKGKTVTVVAK